MADIVTITLSSEEEEEEEEDDGSSNLKRKETQVTEQTPNAKLRKTVLDNLKSLRSVPCVINSIDGRVRTARKSISRAAKVEQEVQKQPDRTLEMEDAENDTGKQALQKGKSILNEISAYKDRFIMTTNAELLPEAVIDEESGPVKTQIVSNSNSGSALPGSRWKGHLRCSSGSSSLAAMSRSKRYSEDIENELPHSIEDAIIRDLVAINTNLNSGFRPQSPSSANGKCSTLNRRSRSEAQRHCLDEDSEESHAIIEREVQDTIVHDVSTEDLQQWKKWSRSACSLRRENPISQTRSDPSGENNPVIIARIVDALPHSLLQPSCDGEALDNPSSEEERLYTVGFCGRETMVKDPSADELVVDDDESVVHGESKLVKDPPLLPVVTTTGFKDRTGEIKSNDKESSAIERIRSRLQVTRSMDIIKVDNNVPNPVESDISAFRIKTESERECTDRMPLSDINSNEVNVKYNGEVELTIVPPIGSNKTVLTVKDVAEDLRIMRSVVADILDLCQNLQNQHRITETNLINEISANKLELDSLRANLEQFRARSKFGLLSSVNDNYVDPGNSDKKKKFDWSNQQEVDAESQEEIENQDMVKRIHQELVDQIIHELVNQAVNQELVHRQSSLTSKIKRIFPKVFPYCVAAALPVYVFYLVPKLR